MKNQYFGDQTDYIKYGIMREFCSSGLIDLFVHWTLTPDDGSSDGSKTRYLYRPELWRHFSPEVFDFIKEEVLNGRRSLDLVEKKNILHGAELCFDDWESNAQSRIDSLDRLIARASRPSLIFLDPDNGLSPGTARLGTPNARKYVFPEELQRVWESGHSFVIYQHYPRVPRLPYLQAQLQRLDGTLGKFTASVITTSHVAFIFCFQDAHAGVGAHLSAQVGSHWSPHTLTYAREDSGELRVASKSRSATGFEQTELAL